VSNFETPAPVIVIAKDGLTDEEFDALHTALVAQNPEVIMLRGSPVPWECTVRR
jgi:hypothetical protein